METQKFPKNFTDLPVIHVYGSARLVGGKRLIIAGLFLLLLCVYYLPLFNTYWEESPVFYASWKSLFHFFPYEFWPKVLVMIVMVPWACSIAGLLIFTFDPSARKKTGRILCIISLVSLIIWRHFIYRSYGDWYKEITNGSVEFWLLFSLFVLILAFCWEKRKENIKKTI